MLGDVAQVLAHQGVDAGVVFYRVAPGRSQNLLPVIIKL
jgi:hypothetical protein